MDSPTSRKLLLLGSFLLLISPLVTANFTSDQILIEKLTERFRSRDGLSGCLVDCEGGIISCSLKCLSSPLKCLADCFFDPGNILDPSPCISKCNNNVLDCLENCVFSPAPKPAPKPSLPHPSPASPPHYNPFFPPV